MTDAYKEGKAAYFSGYSVQANPYQFGTPEYTQWLDGHYDARWLEENM